MTDLREKRKPSFMGNVILIIGAQILVKLLGLVYRLVITNVDGFGDVGNGYYNAGFQVYMMLLAVSSVGIPSAMAKMVSEKVVLGDYKGAHRVFKTAFLLFAGLGLICTLLLFFGAGFVANTVINMPGAQYTLMALAPSIFFVCLSSVIRGYFQGMQNMKATGSAQVLEQIFKSSFTVIIVLMMVGNSPEWMSAGANFATSLATLFSFAYLVLFYRHYRKDLWKKIEGAPETAVRPVWQMMKSILMLSIPISISSIITAMNRVIDTATITRGIEAAFRCGIPGVAGIPTAKALSDEAVRLAGMLSKSDVLTNLPLALNVGFATVLVPSVSGALAQGNYKEASEKVSFSLLISILIIYPCVAGMVSLAQPIYLMLYPNASAGFELLQWSALALLFSALNQTIYGALQGLGKVFVPAIGLLCGGAVKIVLNLILIRQPSINIYGATYSSLACQGISFAICFFVLNRKLHLPIKPVKYFVKPIISCLVMSLVAVLSYQGLMHLLSSNMIATLGAIVLAVITYFVMVIALRILNREEWLMMPFGNKIVKVLYKS